MSYKPNDRCPAVPARGRTAILGSSCFRWPACFVEPGFDLVRVEAKESSEFEVRDSAFSDEASHIADAYAEAVGDCLDVPEVVAVSDCDSHGVAPFIGPL